MNKVYPNRINWENYPSEETPINETNLNKMDYALYEIDDRLIAQDTTKATKTEVATMIADVSFDESTGIFTFTRKNGATFTINTKLEKIAVNFEYNYATQKLVITLIDGTTQEIDLSALVQQNEFLDSDTVAFTIDRTGKVTAIVKEGSIEEKHLQPNYLADIKVVQAKAEAAKNAAETAQGNAENFAEDAEAWAKGTRGGVDVSSTDETYQNSSYFYSQQSKAYMNTWKGSLLPQGKITFSQIPTSGMEPGFLYDITDGFVSDSRFADGAGYSYPAGTNIFWNKDGKWDVIYGILTKELTQAEYDALSEAEKLNGTIYYISDADSEISHATSEQYGVVKVDKNLSDTSTNPVENKTVANKFKDYVTNTELSAKNYLTAETDPTVPLWAKQNAKPSYTASEVGADPSGSASTALENAKNYTDNAIADLINGAPETLDTLKEIADALDTEQSAVEALETAIGAKLDKTGDSLNVKTTFTQATTRANIASGEKHSAIFGKIAKWFADLKTVAFTNNYNDLDNKPTIPTVNNGTLTIQRNGTQVQTFTANQSGNATANLLVPSGAYYGTSDTAAATQVKSATVSTDQNFELKVGVVVGVKFTNTNTYSATAAAPCQLNVNNTGAKNIYYSNTATPTGTNTTAFGYANRYNWYMYDGTYWVWIAQSVDNNTTYSAMSIAELLAGTITTARSVRSDYLKAGIEALGTQYGTCPTAAATAAKVVTLNDSNFILRVGATIAVKFTYTNTAQNPTLNINNTGAKSIWYNTAAITTDSLGAAGTANRIIQFVYDGTYWVWIGWSIDSNNTYSSMSQAEADTGTATTARSITAAVLKAAIQTHSVKTKELTQVQYDALSDTEKKNGTIYFVSD